MLTTLKTSCPILARHCFACHGPDESSRKADLRLDVPSVAETASTSTAVISPGDASASELIRRLETSDKSLRMPPADSHEPLSSRDIEILRRWIESGAVRSVHWSFQPIRMPPVPDIQPLALRDSAEADTRISAFRHPIDSFIRNRLAEEHVVPSPEADQLTLLRRLCFDLTGLPPDEAEIDRWRLAPPEEIDVIYRQTVERLCASPNFAEHWARHWLDVARYADSTGFETDAPRPMWKYRDWVIQSIANNMPFDEFVIRQIAGDLLENCTAEDRTATGFLLCGPQDGGSEASRLDAVVDRTNTVGSALLGLTLGCAQCHTHKFDPISQQEYYQLFAFINEADEHTLEFASEAQIAERNQLRQQLEQLRTERQQYQETNQIRDPKNDPGFQERTARISELEARIPQIVATPVLGPSAIPGQPGSGRRTTIFVRGDYTQPGAVVPAAVPAILPPIRPVSAEKATRLDFARWLVRRDNPLTARVMVNRVWQHLFGRGIVETENDFGLQGELPEHPELLDWLASDFMDNGWDLKGLVRTIVTSSTYRQSSHFRDDLKERDPSNRLLARQSRFRRNGESIRDAALSAAGLLSLRVGGPGVFPVQPEGIMLNRATPAEWVTSPGEDRYRRTMYTFYWRLTPHPLLQTFDIPDALQSCTRRRPANTPLQPLAILNDPIFVECVDQLGAELATAFSRTVGLSDAESSVDAETAVRQTVNAAFIRCLGRLPDEAESAILIEELHGLSSQRVQKSTIQESADAEEASAGKTRRIAADARNWSHLVRVLFSLEEFVIRE